MTDPFILRVALTADGICKISVDGASTMFPLTLSPMIAENIAIVRASRARSRSAGSAEEHSSTARGAEALRSIGTELYDLAFAGNVGIRFASMLDDARRRQSQLPIRIELPIEALLHALPWESLTNARTGFLALNTYTPLVRAIGDVSTEPSEAIREAIRVLVVGGNVSGLPNLDIATEMRQLRKALDALVVSRVVQLARVETLEALFEQVKGPDAPDVIHFVGHGEHAVKSQSGSLFLRDKRGKKQVYADDLTRNLRGRGVRVIVLNVCQGAKVGQGDAFQGIAQQLIGEGLPAVIAMQDVISDRAAIMFSRTVFSTLARGHTLSRAVTDARIAIRNDDNWIEWSTPVLYLGPSDPVVLPKLDGAKNESFIGARMARRSRAWLSLLSNAQRSFVLAALTVVGVTFTLAMLAIVVVVASSAIKSYRIGSLGASVNATVAKMSTLDDANHGFIYRIPMFNVVGCTIGSEKVVDDRQTGAIVSKLAESGTLTALSNVFADNRGFNGGNEAFEFPTLIFDSERAPFDGVFYDAKSRAQSEFKERYLFYNFDRNRGDEVKSLVQQFRELQTLCKRGSWTL